MRASQRKFHFIYKTTCTVTGKWYIGMHSTDNLDDGYLGSGQVLWRSIKRHGKQNHTVEILEFCNDRKTLALREQEVLTEEVRQNPQCMNIAPGGIGYFDRPAGSEQSRQNRSLAAKGKPKSKEHCENIRNARIGMKVTQKPHNGKEWTVFHNTLYPNGHHVKSLMRWAKDQGITNYRRLRASRPVDGFLAIPLNR